MNNLNSGNVEAKLLSVDQVCEMLGAKKTAVYALIKRGLIPAFKVGNAYRIPKSGLLAYMKVTVNNPTEIPRRVFAGIRTINDAMHIEVLIDGCRMWFRTNYYIDEQGRFYEDRKRRHLEGGTGLKRVETPSETINFDTFYV